MDAVFVRDDEELELKEGGAVVLGDIEAVDEAEKAGYRFGVVFEEVEVLGGGFLECWEVRWDGWKRGKNSYFEVTSEGFVEEVGANAQNGLVCTNRVTIVVNGDVGEGFVVVESACVRDVLSGSVGA